jgi:hypothetical protein
LPRRAKSRFLRVTVDFEQPGVERADKKARRKRPMSTSRIDPAQISVQVETARPRSASPPPATPFSEVLKGGANAVMAGAEVAGGVVGGPVVAAAIRQARSSVADSSGGVGVGVGGGVLDQAGNVVNAPPGGEFQAMYAMQRQSQQFNLELLKLQEDVQQENRRFTTLTNVVRAAHETSKSAIGNVRA